MIPVLLLTLAGFSSLQDYSINYFLILHLNPGGIDYEDNIQQSISLDFTFDNLHRKVMKAFSPRHAKALLVPALPPCFFLSLPPPIPLFSLSSPQPSASFSINSILENICLLCGVLSIHTTKEKCWINSAVHNHLHHK